MARGIAKHWLDNPVFLTCWCGKTFQKLADNQLHCSDYHRNLASMLRKYMPNVPPPSPPQKKKPPPAVLPARPAPTDCQVEPGYPGQETVMFSIRDPEMTAHQASDLCPVEHPHRIAECGEFQTP